MVGSHIELCVEIPEFYYREMRDFLEKNPSMNQDDFFLAAISRYLSEKQLQETAIERQIQQTLAA